MSSILESDANASGMIALPRPDWNAAAPLLQLLRSRRSAREFSPRPLSRQMLATLLWAAFGINRPDTNGRTAPSAHGWQEIDVFAVLADAAYRYDAGANALRLISRGDLRGATGSQDFVAAAPLDLVYVADFSKMAGATSKERAFFAAADAAFVAQNVYLFCAATNLSTVVRGLVDRRQLARALGLSVDQRIVLAQTVGYPPGA